MRTRHSDRTRNSNYHNIHISGNAKVHLGDRFDSVDVFAEEWKDSLRLLKWLSFSLMHARRGMISSPFETTFEWMLSLESGNERPKSTLRSWLSSSDSLYWLRGKAGSGKSTLMKMILSPDRAKDALELWSGSHALVRLSYFFWRTGAEMQRSREGLLRSLLHKLFLTLRNKLVTCENWWRTTPQCEKCLAGHRQWQDILQKAFPEWSSRCDDLQPDFEELVGAFKHLLTRKELEARIFIVIDGIDEYDGNGAQRADLVEMLLEFAQSPLVKLIISSRPECTLEHTISRGHIANLEDLTTQDISAFI